MYEPLDTSRREVRLLQLMGGSDDGPIQCSLRTVGLDETDLEFAALSYVWGDESITRDVLVEGHPRAVTANLESALRNFWRYFTENGASIGIRCDLVSSMVDKASVKDRLFVGRSIAAGHRARVGGGYLPIWVDALCINQGDSVEKSQQIPMMRDIYAKAVCVFSWLGPSGHNNLDLALSTIRKLAVRVRGGYSISQLNQDYPELCAIHSDLPPFNKYWEAISNFAEAEYFERVWIFQELWAADSDETIFLCGNEHLPMGSLTRYRAWADPLRTQRSDDTPLFGRFIPIFPLITQIHGIKAGRENAVGATRLFLEVVRRSRCKDPRDMVFALFGIFRMDLTPDYTMPVADVYAAWASNSYQDLPLGSLIFYSGIGLYPRTLGTRNLASWQPDFERLGDQTSWSDTIYAYRHSDAGTPAKYKPTISPIRCFTCFGVQVTKVGKVASQAGKKNVDYTNVTRGMILDYALNSTSMILLLKYLVDNNGRFWTQAYHERGSPLHALVETVNECTDGGDPPTSRLSGDTLREFTPYNLFMKALTVRDDFTVDELKFLGFQSEEELWECLAGMSSNPKDDDGFNPATEPSEGQENAVLGFVSRLLIFSFNKNLFHTGDGRVGGGPPGTETHDLVYLIHGCSLPVLLREVGGKLRHVGVCYIPGLSGLDVFRILKERESDVRELSLV